ncbi:hypothetical protein BU15DRAFT_70846 [Melanogaster broomeanus]|nr:hypothetical protein BU15DRAFT_70846 [Melanogaster broomeanus]
MYADLAADEASFSIVLELNDDKVPSAKRDKDPPPWVPADRQHTTSGSSDDAQLHLLRAVDTGIINQCRNQKINCGDPRTVADSDPKGKGKEKAA